MTTTAFSTLSAVSVRNGKAVATGTNGTIIMYSGECAIGIAEFADHHGLVIYPSPSHGQVQFFRSGEPPSGTIQVVLYHPDGRLAISIPLWNVRNQFIMEDLAAGHYMVIVWDRAHVLHAGRLLVIKDRRDLLPNWNGRL